jgi:hypothetical protein
MGEVDTIQKQTDLIEAVLELSKLEKLTAGPIKIHKTFYKLKRDFPKYFESLMFDTNGHTPISEEIDNIWGILTLSGFIQGDLRSYFLDKNKDPKYAEGLREKGIENPKVDGVTLQIISDRFDEYIQ